MIANTIYTNWNSVSNSFRVLFVWTGIVWRIDFGDCQLIGIIQPIEFGCWSIGWSCPDIRFRALSTDWKFPEKWFQVLSASWICLNSWFRVLPIKWNCHIVDFGCCQLNTNVQTDFGDSEAVGVVRSTHFRCRPINQLLDKCHGLAPIYCILVDIPHWIDTTRSKAA